MLTITREPKRPSFTNWYSGAWTLAKSQTPPGPRQRTPGAANSARPPVEALATPWKVLRPTNCAFKVTAPAKPRQTGRDTVHSRKASSPKRYPRALSMLRW